MELENVSAARVITAGWVMGGEELEDRELVAHALGISHGELHGHPTTRSKVNNSLESLVTNAGMRTHLLWAMSCASQTVEKDP
jgi:hypothetical protein